MRQEGGASSSWPEPKDVAFRRGFRGELHRSQRPHRRTYASLASSRSTFVGETSARAGRAARSIMRKRQWRNARPFAQGRYQAMSVQPDALAACAIGLPVVEDCHVSPLSRMSGRQRQNTTLRWGIKSNLAQALLSMRRHASRDRAIVCWRWPQKETSP